MVASASVPALVGAIRVETVPEQISLLVPLLLHTSCMTWRNDLTPLGKQFSCLQVERIMLLVGWCEKCANVYS